jgi:rhodanese-related sulfurtransferase
VNDRKIVDFLFVFCFWNVICRSARNDAGYFRQEQEKKDMFGLNFGNKLSPKDAVEGARDGAITVIDVREHGEVAMSGKAAGALHIPLVRLRDMADPRHPDYNRKLDQESRIAVYCASGARSFSAARLLRQLGYGDVHNIGGLGHWVRAGGAIEAL